MALKVGELFASFGIDTKGLDGAISGIEKKCQSLSKGLTVAGAAATAALTVPLTKAAKEIFSSGSEFDSQMSRVEAISGATTEQMEQLTAKAKEMGATTSFTAKEAGEALEYMGMAGWKTDQMLVGLAPIMDLAAASGENLGMVSDIVTDALTAFGMSADEAGRFADVLAATATNANTNVGMMGESFKYIAPLAGTMGYSIEDMAVALGLMANSGIKSSQAGTTLRQVLQNMISPTKSQAAAMEYLDLSLYDANGNIKDFGTLMKDMRNVAKRSGFDVKALQEEVGKLDSQLASGVISQEEYDKQVQSLTDGNDEFLQSISDLAGARGLSGLLAIMNASDEDFDSLTSAINGSSGAASNMAKIMLDNVGGSLTLFNSALDGAKLELWDLVKGPIKSMIDRATEWVTAFNNMDDKTQLLVLKLGALAAAIGPTLLFAGRLVSVFGKLIPLMFALNGPLGVVVGGLGLFALAAIDTDNTIGETFENIANTIKEKLDGADEKIEAFFGTVSERIPALANSISTGIATALPSLIHTGFVAIGAFMGVVSERAKDILNIGSTIVTTLIEGIGNELPQLIPKAAEMVTSLYVATILNAPKLINAGIDLIDKLIIGILNTDWVALAVKIKDALIQALGNIEFGKLLTISRKLVTGIIDAIPGLVGLAAQFARELGALIGGINWESVGANLAGLAISIIDSLISALNTSDFGGVVEAIGTGLIRFASGLMTAAIMLVRKLGEYLLAPETLASIIEAGKGLLDSLSSAIASIGPDFEGKADIIKAALEGIGVALLALKGGSLISGGVTLLTSLGGAFTTLVTAINPVGLAIAAVVGIIMYFWNTSEEFRNAVIAIWNGITEGVRKAVENMFGFFNDLIEGVKKVIKLFTDPNGAWAEMQENKLQIGVEYNIPPIELPPDLRREAEDQWLAQWNGDPTLPLGYTLDQEGLEGSLQQASNTVNEYADSTAYEITDLSVKQEALDELVAQLNKVDQDVTAHASETAGKAMSAASTEIQKADLKTPAETAAQAVVNAFKSVMTFSAGDGIGANLASGLKNGIKNGASSIASAAKSAAQSALNAAKRLLGIKSPSRVARDEIGAMFDEGLALGLIDRISTVQGASERVSEALMDAQYIGEPSRGTVLTGGQSARQTAQETVQATSASDSLIDKAKAIGEAIAAVLIDSGALDSDVIMDGTLVGRKTSPTVSKQIGEQVGGSVLGRVSQGVMAR